MTVGAALALKDTGRLTIGLMGDGEFLGAPSALWSAAHYKIPVLFVIANNRSYYTDEVQQEAVTHHRGRPAENKWIGQRIDEPAIDLRARRRFWDRERAQITDPAGIAAALERGLRAVEAGASYLLDIRINSTRGSSLDWLNHH